MQKFLRFIFRFVIFTGWMYLLMYIFAGPAEGDRGAPLFVRASIAIMYGLIFTIITLNIRSTNKDKSKKT